VYVAAWISPLVAPLGMVIKNTRTGTTDTQWSDVDDLGKAIDGA
jgi:hypothetical protein